MIRVFRAAAVKQLDGAVEHAGLPLEWVMGAAGREPALVILHAWLLGSNDPALLQALSNGGQTFAVWMQILPSSAS